VFQTNPLPTETQDAVARISSLIDADRFDEARAKLEELESKLGGLDVEVHAPAYRHRLAGELMRRIDKGVTPPSLLVHAKQRSPVPEYHNYGDKDALRACLVRDQGGVFGAVIELRKRLQEKLGASGTWTAAALGRERATHAALGRKRARIGRAAKADVTAISRR